LKKYENNNFVIFKTVINLKKMIVPYFYDQWQVEINLSSAIKVKTQS
jgi:hypothetical protein